MKRRGFATILVLLVVVLVGGVGVGWYLSNTGIIPKFSSPATTSPTTLPAGRQAPALPIVPGEDETANWETYTNTKHSYSIKYPDNWEVLEITNEPVGTGEGMGGKSITTPLKDFYRDRYQENVRSIITLVDPQDIVGSVVPKKVGDMWISGIRLEVKAGTIKEELDKYYFTNDYKTEEVKVGNLAVTKISGFNQRFETGTSTALIEKNGLLYKLSNDLIGSGHGNEFFDQILSTFKFF